MRGGGYRARADQGARGGIDAVQPDPVGASVLRCQAPGRPVRPGGTEPARRAVPVAVGRGGVQRGSGVQRGAGQYFGCGGPVRAVEGARLFRFRVTGDGEGDAAPAGRTADPVDPHQVRRLRRYVRSRIAAATTAAARTTARIGPAWLPLDCDCAGGVGVGLLLGASGGTSAVKAAYGFTIPYPYSSSRPFG